ncbi:MAG: tetraacyldisaccharide 4'-kinase [Hyphomicrobiales bacterium]|nr:tetraacyldisaccharide 4'-kinase [Hyphomicrobiales bacterium]
MRLEPPSWWYGDTLADRLKAALLMPVGALYDQGVKARFALTTPYRSTLPVVCIGNFTVGGAGKTPLALATAAMLRELGHSPAFLTRGFGGRLAGPHFVDPDKDVFADVGDEALLLARAAPTVLSRKRSDGARAIEASGASVIVMDDGFQNPSLAKDLSLIAADVSAGLGNGRVFPAGPLRAALSFQKRRADALVLIGEADAQPGLAGLKLPAIHAVLEPAGDLGWLNDRPVLAFCGIGRPQKFFDTLKDAGATLADQQGFPDHHPFSEGNARSLLKQAAALGAQLVTTEKDWSRLSEGEGAIAELKVAARTLPVKLGFSADGAEHLLRLLRNLPTLHR